MSRRYTARRIVGRRLRSRPATSVLVVVIATLTALIATAAPRLVEQQSRAEVAYQLERIGAPARSLQGSAPYEERWAADPPPDLDQLYGELDASFASARKALPQPLRGLVGEAQWMVQTPTLQATRLNGATTLLGIQLTADRDYRSRVTIVKGTAPATWPVNEVDGVAKTRTTPVDILISTTAASQLKLKVGDLLGSDVSPARASGPQVGPVAGRLYRVSGLYEPKDAHAEFWQQNPALIPVTTTNANSLFDYPNFAAFVAPLTPGRLSTTFYSAQTSVYFPVSPRAGDVDPDLLRSQLARAGVVGVELPGGDTPLPLATRSTVAIATATERGTLLGSLLAFSAGAPIGVLVAVLVLTVQIVMRSRRPDLLLASARGAGAAQLRITMALEGALLTLPLGVIAVAAAVAAVPASVTPMGILLPVIAVLAVPALYAALTPTSATRSPLADLLARLRWVLEVGVVLLAGLSLFLLVRRGLASTSGAVGVDPLLALAPLLLAIACGTLVLRVFPLLMRAAQGAASRSRALPSFVGALRAARAPTVGLAGVLALVVGISASLFSAVLLTTFEAGVSSAVSEQVGADARVDSISLTASQRRIVASLPGVAEVAGVQSLGSETVTGASTLDSTTMLLAESVELGKLRTLPHALDTEVGGRVPVLVSSDLGRALPVGTRFSVHEVGVVVVGSLPAASGLGVDAGWVLADSRFASKFGTTFTPGLLLIKADPARLPRLLGPLTHAVGADQAFSTATVSTLPQVLAERADEPVTRGIRFGLTAGAILSLLLCAVGLVLSTIAAGGARARVAGVLRTLGMPRRQLRTLTAWELIPVATTALLGGAALGLVLPFVVTAAVDLRSFTGSAARIAPQFAWPVLVAVLALFALVVLVSAIVAIAVGDRVTPSTAIKLGDS